jgi:hypothetical protein
MKAFRILIIAGLMMIISYSCGLFGDEYVCGDFWFVNKTGYKINVDSYCFGNSDNELSFIVGPHDSIKRISCGLGYARNPFTSSTCGLDSILLVFNDTLALNTFKYLEFAPINNIEKISKTKFRYEFTEAHFQKALEVNGY